MNDSLPSLNALRVFETVARLQHFRRAAEALSLSPAAVSQHMRQLEAALGVALFERSRQGAQLTAAGRQLQAGVEPALAQLRDAVQYVSEGRARAAPTRLRLAVLPSLATCWLYARLLDWQQRHPQWELDLQASTAVQAMKGIDAALRFGPGRWPDALTERLAGDRLVAVAAPALLQRLPAAVQREPAQLFARLPLLRHSATPWAPWLAEAGLDARGLDWRASLRDAGVQVAAARAAQGLALTRFSLVADSLASGELRQVHPHSPATDWAYHLARPRSGRLHPGLNALRDWLRAQFRASGLT